MRLIKFLSLSLTVAFQCKIHSYCLQNMNIEEKIGQLFLVHFTGSLSNEESERLLCKAHIGGFIYYEWCNELSSLKQVQQLSRSLQNTNLKYSPIPLFIAIDQEGGRVTRLKKDFTQFPSSFEIGKLNIPSLTYQVSFATGQELKLAGINMNLAPVADIVKDINLSIIGNRSFGSCPSQVASHVHASLKGLSDAHVLPVVKHFPGLGDISSDPHYMVPVVKKSIDELNAFDLQPYKALQNQIEALMSSHCIVEQIDPSRTITISPFFITDILRNNWKYDGLVLTDSLVMKGKSFEKESIERIALKSLLAGNDMLCLGGKLLNEKSQNEITADDVIRIHSYLIECVKTGQIREKEIDEKVARILKLKQKYAESTSSAGKNESIIFSKNSLVSNEVDLLLQIANIDRSVAKKIALKIWHNEAGCSKERLVFWNQQEDFISLGIGHFIWHPEESKSIYKEMFPQFVDFLKKQQVDIPEWIASAAHCPWKNRSEFLANINSQNVKELRELLEETVDLQGKFMIASACENLHEIISHLGQKLQLDRVLKVLEEIISDPRGIYALVDYMNFKGSGLSESERYHGHGWGLMQVIETLCRYPSSVSVNDFCFESKKLLQTRTSMAKNPEIEKKWLTGWNHRIDTYAAEL